MNTYHRLLRGILLVGCLLMVAPAGYAANILQTYYAPFPENSVQMSLEAIDNYGGNIGDVMRTVISIVPSMSNTLVYYDHWEDGYEADITSPTQTTTEIWGDNNTTNGIAPGFASDLVNAGSIINLEGSIDVTRNEINIEYDGRDKFSVTRPVSVSRAMYAIDPGEVLAGSCQTFDTSQYGLEFRAPVGVDVGVGAGTNETFEYTAFYIMAAYDFTQIEIDEDNDGVVDITLSLDEGESYEVNGGVMAGASVVASKPIQCHLLTGDPGSNYEMRWYTMWPRYQWGDYYYTPVGGRWDGGNYHPAFTYLYNPSNVAVTYTYETESTTGTVTVAANSVSSPIDIPADSGAIFYSTNGYSFVATEVFDGWDNPATAQALQRYDWGLGLPPRKTLTTMGIVGWGPGNGSTAPGVNGNPVWATAVSNTTLYIDYDGDPSTGPLTDPFGNMYDYSTNVVRLQSVQLFDNTDTNQTGMRVYTADGTFIVTAWGEDPLPAEPGNPYLDMGNIILPFPTVFARKYATLHIDLNTNGIPDSGDSLKFFVEVVNVGFAQANGVVLEDNGATNKTTYQAGSTTTNGGAFADDFVPPRTTVFPFDEGGASIGSIPVDGTTIVSYVTTIVDPYPTNEDPCVHNEAIVTETNGQWSTIGSECVAISGLVLTKSNDPDGLVLAGSTIGYTIAIENTGNVAYTGLELQDLLPVGVQYVADTMEISMPFATTNSVYDRFNFQNYTNNNGLSMWTSAWTEEGEADGALVGDVAVRGDIGTSPPESFALQIDGPNNGAYRTADLSSYSNATLSFDYRRDGLDGGDDIVALYLSDDGGATWSAAIDSFAGAATDTDYVFTNYDITAYISTSTAVRFFSPGTLEDGDSVWFDDVKITYNGTGVTNAGAAPPQIFELYTLPPGETITVTFDVTVEDPPTATQFINVARTRAVEHVDWLYDQVTNHVDATVGVVLTKTNNPDGEVSPSDTIAYTITIENTGTTTQTGIELDDILPLGVTYVPDTAEVWRPFAHTNNLADNFDSEAYTNQNGNVDWLNDWQEIGDDDDPQAGDVLVDLDGDAVPGRVYALSIDDNDNGAWRMADLSGYSSATLSFDYRREGLDDGAESVSLYFSDDGGASWSGAIDTYAGAATDAEYIQTNYDLTAYISSNTAIRFLSSAGPEDGDYVWFDSIDITYSGSNSTNNLHEPTDLFDGYHLPPGTSMVITLDVTVDDPPTATQMVNTARMRSDQQVDWLYDYTTNWQEATPGLSLTKASSVNGHYWGVGETGTYTMVVVNTGTLTQTSVAMEDPLPQGVSYVAGSTVVVISDIQTNITTNITVAGNFTNNVLDQFGTAAFDNNDGGTNWSDDWQENGPEAAGPGAGSVQIAGGELRLDDHNDQRPYPGAYREVDLGIATGAQFVVDIDTSGDLEDNDTIDVWVSDDGGLTTNVLETIVNDLTATRTYDITSYLSTNTVVGFIVTANYGGGTEYFYADNVEVEYWWDEADSTNITTNVVSSITTNSGGVPPWLAAGYTLTQGVQMTVTFDVTLDLPTDMTEVTNTAYVTSAQNPQLDATVTDIVTSVSVGDYVWHDVNMDGIQDGGNETGIPGVVVNLYDANTNLLSSTSTDSNGYYIFTGWPTSEYFLGFEAPTNWYLTEQDAGGDTVDSDASSNTGYTVSFVLDVDASNMTYDAGLFLPPSSIGDFVWLDLNTNGVQDGGAETGFPDVTVNLYDSGTNLIGVTTTDGTGFYSFTNLPPNDYFVQFEVPAGYAITPQDQGGDDSVDSDANPATGATTVFTLPSGVNVTIWDAGIIIPIPSLTINKVSDAGGCVAPGQIIEYIITVENTGTVAMTGVQVVDPTPTGTTYVAGSALVTLDGTSTNAVRDEFNAQAYTNNDGTVEWQDDWDETEPYGNDDDPVEGYIQVVGNRLNFSYTWTEEIERSTDISGYTNAVLSFDWETVSLDAGETMAVLVGTNDVGTFVQLETFGGTQSGSTNFDINAYIATNTTIRFDNTGANWSDAGDDFYADNIQVAFETSGVVTNPGSAPPILTSGKTLDPGETLTVIFQVSNNSPSTVTQIVNTATVTADPQPPVMSTITDDVCSVDLGVIKDPNKSTPYGTNELVWFTITLTNNGPTDATGIELTDTWPAEVIYYWSSASQGTYNHGDRKWYVGDLDVGEAVTLWMTGRVNVAAESYITNWIEITYLNEIDTNPLNNKDDAAIETLVVLSRFEAFEVDGHVVIEWETVSEIDTVGFYLYRWDPVSASYVKVSDEMLPGLLGVPQGGVYRMPDEDARPHVAYEYKLVEVERTGRENTYGPFAVAASHPDSGRNVRKSRLEVQRATRATKARRASLEKGYLREARGLTKSGLSRRTQRTKERASTTAARSSGNRVKIGVKEAGIYYVSCAEIGSLVNVPEYYVQDLLLAGRLVLKNLGEPVDFAMAYGAAGIIFYGEGPDSIYADENVYWVSLGDSHLLEVRSGGMPLPAGGGETFLHIAHSETNKWPSLAVFDDPEGDYWLWNYVIAGSSSMSNAVVTVDLPGLAATVDDAVLRVKLHGVTTTGVENEHHVVVLVNGVEVAEASWGGDVAYAVITNFSQANLVDGVNTIEVQARKGTGVSLSVVGINAVDLRYHRKYEAVDDELVCRGDGNAVVTVSGFTSPYIYVVDVSDPERPVHVVENTIDEAGGLYRISFMPETPGAEYYVLTSRGIQAPDWVVADQKSTVSTKVGADYVVISPAALTAASEKLAAYRQAQGWLTHVVALEDIYDGFGYGMKSPRAIKDFLDYAYTYWSVAPRCVVLAGKGTYDYKNYTGNDDNLVPAKLVRTERGLFASDNWYADVVGEDGVPEMAIGRLPVLTSAEMSNCVQKIISYETGTGAWQQRVMLVADDPDAGGDFPADSDKLVQWLDADYHDIQKTYRTEYSTVAARQRVLDGLNEGASVMNYIGHGGTDRFASEGVLRSGDLGSLTNDMTQPVVVGMTCIAGRYELPGSDCLAENLVLHPDGGAVAVWTASGMSINSAAQILDEEFFKAMFVDGEPVLGEIMLKALENYADRNVRWYLMGIYNLLGDPALQLPQQ